MNKTSIGFSVQLKTDFEIAITRVTDALKTEGFGVLTEIDVKATLKNKLGVDFRPYKILGACNPPFAHQALTVAPEVGLLLPCNVTVEQSGEQAQITFIDPIAMLSVINNPALEPIAEQVRARLERVAASLEK